MSKLTDFATPHSRTKLDTLASRQPHWRFLAKRKALGYRVSDVKGTPGTWWARYTVPVAKRYKRTTLGAADDGRRSADGVDILSFEQAQKKALEWCEDQERALEGLEPPRRQLLLCTTTIKTVHASSRHSSRSGR